MRTSQKTPSSRRSSMKVMHLLACMLSVVMIVAALGLPGQAQVVSVTVQGRVYDTSGAAVPNAAVTATNAGTGLSRATVSSVMGDYQITSLPPGDYTEIGRASCRERAQRSLE